MKKILFFSFLALLLGFGCVAYQAKADDPECLPNQVLVDGVCVYPSSSTPIFLILQSYCKPGVVVYSDWSECDKRFGKNGLQWRQIVYPTPGGCNPSVYDQVNAVRECLK